MRHSTFLLLLDPTAAGAAGLPLDGVTSVTAAWSLRQLYSDYTGPAVKVRRASDDMELDVGFTAGELDTVTLSEFLSETTGTVVSLYDQSGNDRHMAQATALLQPTISLSVANLNGKPGIVGDAGPFIRSSYDLPHEATLLIAYSDYVDDSLYGAYMGGFYPFTNTNRWRLNSGGPAAYIFSGGLLAADHNIGVFDWDYDNDIYKAYLDGTPVVDATDATDYPLAGGNPGQLMLMATRDTGLDPLVGNLAEAVLLEGAATADRNAVGQAMADYYAFDWTDIA